MPLYSVYAANGGGSRMTRAYSFRAANTLEAESFVIERLTQNPVELWFGSRRLARFEGKRAC